MKRLFLLLRFNSCASPLRSVTFYANVVKYFFLNAKILSLKQSLDHNLHALIRISLRLDELVAQWRDMQPYDSPLLMSHSPKKSLCLLIRR